MSVKKKAFTLAEVLVTLMIIGVIASMTIPGLKKNFEEESYVVGAKNAYSILSQASKRVEMERGEYKRWMFKDTSDDDIQRMFDYYRPYLNIARECKPNSRGCWQQTKGLNNKPFTYSTLSGVGANTISFSLTNGMNVCLDGTGDAGVDEGFMQLGMWVDVNGDKKPNKFGVDVFLFVMTPSRGLLPAGIDDSSNCKMDDVGTNCAYLVLKTGKLPE